LISAKKLKFKLFLLLKIMACYVEQPARDYLGISY